VGFRHRLRVGRVQPHDALLPLKQADELGIAGVLCPLRHRPLKRPERGVVHLDLLRAEPLDRGTLRQATRPVLERGVHGGRHLRTTRVVHHHYHYY
jgi:hypothetical protein